MSRQAALLIVGASARAAAFSALRAGLVPWCADLFADLDLQGRCQAVRLPGRYPRGFLSLIGADVPAGPWMYTGGLENHPELVDELARRRPLWGNPGGVLREVRRPAFLAGAARAAGLPAPALPKDLPTSGSWLLKPLAGSGGAGIRPWVVGDPLPPNHYLQQRIDGEAAAALYAALRGQARLLSLTRQLIGEGWLHAGPFRYCGSIGPVEAQPALWAQLERLGDAVAQRCGLRGLFGVDGLLHGGDFWPVEINPRYTASMEVLEHATGLRVLDWHRRAFEDVPGLLPPLPPGPCAVGKAVLFAEGEVVFPADGPWRACLTCPVTEMPDLADLPHPGDRIEAGRPVLTVFARAADQGACLAALGERVSWVKRWLRGGREGPGGPGRGG